MSEAFTPRVGLVLHGFCGGHFGRDSHEDKRVEAIGADWVVVRGVDTEQPSFGDFVGYRDRDYHLQLWSQLETEDG